jgi:hypothetical protein
MPLPAESRGYSTLATLASMSTIESSRRTGRLPLTEPVGRRNPAAIEDQLAGAEPAETQYTRHGSHAGVSGGWWLLACFRHDKTAHFRQPVAVRHHLLGPDYIDKIGSGLA